MHDILFFVGKTRNCVLRLAWAKDSIDDLSTATKGSIVHYGKELADNAQHIKALAEDYLLESYVEFMLERSKMTPVEQRTFWHERKKLAFRLRVIYSDFLGLVN